MVVSSGSNIHRCNFNVIDKIWRPLFLAQVDRFSNVVSSVMTPVGADAYLIRLVN